MKDLRQLYHFLGISVQCQPTGLFLSQQAWLIIEDSKPCTTLVDTSLKFSGDTGDPVSDPTHYRSLSGALQYLTFTRPDISYMI
jgi:hypothetical protein